MTYKAINIDEEGFYVCDIILNHPDEALNVKNIITEECPDGFYLPRWNGKKWVEGKTAEEISKLKDAVKEVTVETDVMGKLKKLESIIADLTEVILENGGIK